MTAITLTSKGQATIPKVIRDLLGVKPGGRISFEVREGDVVVRAAQSPAGMLAAYGKIRSRRTTRESVGSYLGHQDEKTRSR